MRVTGKSMRGISPARRVAFATLSRVESGGYASDALREESQGLSARDAGLAGQIVFGCLRYQGQLDFLIFHHSGRQAVEFDEKVRITLRAAIFQLRYLERVPAHAAVHESVEYIKFQKRAASGLVNAVLRKVNRKPLVWPDLATELSCPAWLFERWEDHFGAEAARKIATAALEEPTPYVRIAPGLFPRTDLQVEPTGVAGAYRLLSPLPPDIRLHDISSQAIVPLLGLRPGDIYLDVCAAPGNKTLQALETPLQMAVACDASPRRIREIPPVCARVVLDATEPLPFQRSFDRIFVDAPCSGTGTLGRNPEIKWRVKIEDFARFREKQIAIVSQALRVLKPGGQLLYATCSLEREENEEVIETILTANSSVQRKSETWRLPGREQGDGFFAALLESQTSAGAFEYKGTSV